MAERTFLGAGWQFYVGVDDQGRIESAAYEESIRQAIGIILRTAPGERVMRPEFGCGVQRLVFAGASQETVAAAEYVIATGIRKYMSDLIQLDAVRVTVDDTQLIIDILYTVPDSGEELATTITRPLEGTP